MSTKKKFLISFRMNRDSYFAVTRMMPELDRDQSWCINKACELGLLALAADPHAVKEDEALAAVRKAQAMRLRELEMRDRPHVDIEAGSEA